MIITQEIDITQGICRGLYQNCRLAEPEHNCTAILIQCVSGLRCSSFLLKALCRRRFRALLHESPSLRPLRKPRKLVPTDVEPSALLHDCFLKGALLHDCSGLSCNSGRRILGLFPSRRRKQKRLKRALGHCRARFPLSSADNETAYMIARGG